MTIAYFDCFSGAAGDMILGALISAGLDVRALREDLAALGVEGYQFEANAIKKQGFAAYKVDVTSVGDHAHRHLHHITEIINQSTLADGVKNRSIEVFTRLAEAEAKVHGTTVEKVHFHEVGAIDAIVDVVGAVAGLERLGITEVACSSIPTGNGTVKCEHGIMPVPAPATAELLRDVPLAECREMGELTTPTGAAILTTLSNRFGPVPAMSIRSIGYGAGTRDGTHRPNVLRVLIGEPATAMRSDEVAQLQVNLDDCTGEQVSHAMDQLFEAGAVDVFTTPIMMKKSRPGVMLTVLAPLDCEEACRQVIFRETTTFGIRRQLCARSKLDRRFDAVETPYGAVRVKIGFEKEHVIQAAPEYDDCRRCAAEHDVPLKQVMDAAMQAWSARQDAG